MTLTARRLWYRVKINDAWVTTAGDIRISESVDQLSRVAEFDLAEQPATEPEEGDTVLIEQFDFDEGTVTAVYGGTINALSIESQPWAMTCVCNDQLRLLDRVRQGSDLVFGEPDGVPAMSPKEALMEVLDACGCTYDPADLADPDYVLGEREQLSWLVDTPGSQITNELSTVFGCVLLTVGNDRILWLSHDSTPSDGTGSYATYTRGTSIDFGGHGRQHGDRARIQNNWIVRGVTAQTSKQCTSTPWAKAVGTNPQLGRRRRTAEQTFQSDLIQSEDLAEAIVRRLMRETNRLPDERTTPIVNDHNVHPASKITIVDPTYGMGANPTYATVLAVDRTGSRMTLRLAAGPGGAEGTVTTGVDKVCNDTHTDLDWPGDGFDFPDFDFPPIDFGDPIDFDLDLDIPPPFTPDGLGGTDVGYTPIGGTEPDPGGFACATPLDADWVIDNQAGAAPITGDGFVQCSDAVALHNDGLSVNAGVSWELRATVTASANNSVQIGMGADGETFQYYCLIYGADETVPGVEVGTISDDDFDPTDLSGGAVDVVLFYDAEAAILYLTAGSVSLSVPDLSPPAGPFFPCVRIYDLGGAPLSNGEAADMQLCTGLSPVIPLAGDWTTEFGTITYPGDGELSFADTDDAQAFYDDAAGDVFPFLEETRFRWSGHCDRTGTDGVFVSFYLMNAANDAYAAVELLFDPGGDVVSFYSFPAGSFEGDDPGALPDEFDFTFDWNPDAGTLSAYIDGGLRGSFPLGTWPAEDLFPKIGHGSAATMAMDFTEMVFVVEG